MLTDISKDLKEVNDSRKTAVINNELMRLTVDIAGDTSWCIQGNRRRHIWQGKGSGDHREYGVGFVESNASSMPEWAQITTRGPPVLDSSARVK